MVHGVAAWQMRASVDESDAALVREARRGVTCAFDRLVRRHRPRLRRILRSVLRDRADAEDVVQQALLQAFAGLESWSGTAPFSIWLTRIAMNEALMRIRRSRRLAAAAVLLARLDGAEPPDPEQEVATREEMARVSAALPRLPARHREILQLASISELSRADVAERLGVSEGAVKVRLHRARKALRGILREVEPPLQARTPPLVLASPGGGLIGFGGQGSLLRD